LDDKERRMDSVRDLEYLYRALAARGDIHSKKIALLGGSYGGYSTPRRRGIYGREGCITLTSSPSTKVILRVDETETAKWASQLIGSHEIERLSMTQLAGLSTYREGINLQPHRSIELLVLPDEIELLQPFTGYLCIAGHHRTTIHIPESHLTVRHPAFIPRAFKSSVPTTTEPDDDEIAAKMTARAIPSARE
jgi:hypothetical protein